MEVSGEVALKTGGDTPKPSAESLSKIIAAIRKVCSDINGTVETITIRKRSVFFPARCTDCRAKLTMVDIDYTKPAASDKDLTLRGRKKDVVSWCPECDLMHTIFEGGFPGYESTHVDPIQLP